MRRLAPRLPRDAAWQRFAQGGFGRRWGRKLGLLEPIAPSPPDEPQVFPRLETDWLPNYRVSFTAQTSRKSAEFDVLVNAHSGYAVLANLSRDVWLEEAAKPAVLELSPERASEIARALVVRALLGKRGWGGTPEILGTGSPELIGYPVWAYYFSTRTGMLDAKLLDALSGAACGPQFKIALLATLAGRQQPTNNLP